MPNKVKYNLKNVHYAKQTDVDGVIGFDTPIKWPGAVSLDLPPEGEELKFHADGVVYYASYTNSGYSGTLEMALIPDGFRKDILGEIEDATTKVLYESAEARQAPFALLFEFDGDVKSIRHVLYNVSAARPNISGSTNTETKQIATESLSITAIPAMIGGKPLIKARTQDSTTEEAYNNWYQAVNMPSQTVTV